MSSKFEHLNSIENLNDKSAALSSMIAQVLQSNEWQEMLEWIAQESHSLTFARFVLNQLLIELKSKDDDVKYEILLSALEIFSQRVTAFEEQITIIREELADIAQSRDEFTLASNYLIGIPLDSGHRQISNNTKLKYYIRISRLLLEDEDFVGAESYINRAGFLLDNTVEKITQLQFKAAQARILDMKRQFLPAATKYLELSLDSEMHISERNEALKAAITCCILAGAGPQRSRMLNILYKDERLHVKESDQSFNEFSEKGLYRVLEEMFHGRVLKKDQVEEFQESLAPHQLARMADGSTVFDRAVMEHNLLSVSNLFSNISFQMLGYLLSVSPSQAEQIAASMIGEDRMSGSIDQVDSLIHFTQPNPVEEWNQSIVEMYEQLDRIVSAISQKHPNLMNSL